MLSRCRGTPQVPGPLNQDAAAPFWVNAAQPKSGRCHDRRRFAGTLTRDCRTVWTGSTYLRIPLGTPPSFKHPKRVPLLRRGQRLTDEEAPGREVRDASGCVWAASGCVDASSHFYGPDHPSQRMPPRIATPDPDTYHCGPSMKPAHLATSRRKYSTPITKYLVRRLRFSANMRL